MAKCDLCGGDCKASEMLQLLASYQSAGVVDICPACRRWADKLRGSLLDEIAPRMRAAIAERKELKASTLRLRWWQRLGGT